MSRRKKTSIRDLARITGYSTATVSRVLNKDPRVKEETSRTVLAAMQKHKYTPSPFGHGIPKIGVVYPWRSMDYYNALMDVLIRNLQKDGYQVMSCSYITDDDRRNSIRAFNDAGVDGLIMIKGTYNEVQNILRPNIPYTWIDCDDVCEHLDVLCNVQSDHFNGGVLAAEELLRDGCTAPIVLNGDKESARQIDRNNGFFSVFRKANITLEEERFQTLPMNEDPLEAAKKRITQLLESGMVFDSVFAISDRRALGAYLSLREHGLRVPEEIKVISFDGADSPTRALLSITSVQQNIELIARASAIQLLSILNGKTPLNTQIIVPMRILPGKTA